MSGLTTSEPIDFVHLARYTGGDAQLNAEVLELFVQHCRESLQTLDRFSQTPDPKPWREAAHALKGSALGIGAFALAKAAGDAEAMDPFAEPERINGLLRSLRQCSAVVLTCIEDYLTEQVGKQKLA